MTQIIHIHWILSTLVVNASHRSFHAAAPVVWNSLPAQLRSASINPGQFTDGLKTHLFLHDPLRALV